MALLSTTISLLNLILPAYSRALPGPLRGDPWYRTRAQSAAQNGSQPIKWLDCHDRVPSDIQGIVLNVTSSTPLPPSLACGEIVVPMDYTKPISTTNNITVGFAMSRPANRANSSGLIAYHAGMPTISFALFFSKTFQGGPGIPAASKAWATTFNMSETFTGLENFDIIGSINSYPAINVRGLEFSTPLNCTPGVFFNDPLVNHPFPTSHQEYDAYQTGMTNFLSSCNNTSPPGLMEHVGTVNVIQDMDTLRDALGYETLNFAGVSYGTFVGAAYVAQFPDRVGRFVIDAVIPHGMPFQEMIDHQMVAINRLLLRSDAFCMTDPACPFHGQGKGAVVKAWDTLLAKAITEPIPAPSCGTGLPFNGGPPCNTPVTATDLRFGVHASFRSDSDFPLFNLALDQALNGNASLFGYMPLEDIRESVVSPLLCSDFRMFSGFWSYFRVVNRALAMTDSQKTFDGFNNFSSNSQPNDPHSIIYSQTWQIALMCSAWPYTVPEQPTPNNNVKVMWVTSDYDLNLPTELTTFAWEQTPNASLVIRHGDDHTSIDFTGPPGAAADLARNFIKTGVMPTAEDNAQITVISPGGTRGPVPDPYDVPTGLVAGDVSIVENITTSSNSTSSSLSNSPSSSLRTLPPHGVVEWYSHSMVLAQGFRKSGFPMYY
ncbi:hypothetical protein B0H13DRAFT_2270961 [Mycena leptocephala]|nr:hypothetical protein B0H13DRAFT_2270961 [Mycena leptocephala]